MGTGASGALQEEIAFYRGHASEKKILDGANPTSTPPPSPNPGNALPRHPAKHTHIATNTRAYERGHNALTRMHVHTSNARNSCTHARTRARM